MNTKPEFLSIPEAAACANIPERMIRMMINDGSLKFIKSGRKYLINKTVLSKALGGDGKTFPSFKTTGQVSKETGFRIYFIKNLVKNGKVKGVKNGNRLMINVESLEDYLDNGESL